MPEESKIDEILNDEVVNEKVVINESIDDKTFNKELKINEPTSGESVTTTGQSINNNIADEFDNKPKGDEILNNEVVNETTSNL